MKKISLRVCQLCAVVLLAFCLVSRVEASIQTIDASDTGWWSSSGNHLSYTDNYLVGQLGESPSAAKFRDFFIFDLGSVNKQITSARLELTAFLTLDGDPAADHSVYDLGLFDVHSSLSDVVDPTLHTKTIYDDLGSGKSYGNFSMDLKKGFDDKLVLKFDLNNDAVSDINQNKGSKFAIGGSLLNLPEDNERDFALFGNSGEPFDKEVTKRLVLEFDDNPGTSTVPEPATITLFGAGLFGLWQKRRRKN